MNNITLKQVYSALCAKIGEEYPGKEIYGSSVHQNLDEGDFNIIPVSVNIVSQIGDKVLVKLLFDCIYYAEDYDELLEMAEGLPLAIRKIKTDGGDVLHGTMNTPAGEIYDGVLHCMVSYDYFGLIKHIVPDGEYEDGTDLMYYLKQQFLGVKY